MIAQRGHGQMHQRPLPVAERKGTEINTSSAPYIYVEMEAEL